MPILKMHQHWAGRWVITTHDGREVFSCAHEEDCAEELLVRLNNQTPLNKLVYALQQLQDIKITIGNLPAVYGTSALEWSLMEEIQKEAKFAGNPDHVVFDEGELRIMDVDGRTLYVLDNTVVMKIEGAKNASSSV